MTDKSELAILARRKAAAKRSRLRRKERGEPLESRVVMAYYCPVCRRPSTGPERCEFCNTPLPA